MDPEAASQPSSRETLLAVLMGLALGGATMVFLFLMCGGLVVWGALVLATLAAIAGLNYLLWGRALSRNVAGEREEAEIRSQAEEDGWPLPEPRHPRHF